MNATAVRLREEKGLTQFEVAQKTGIHPSQLSRLESGTGRPGLDGLIRLARFYGTNVETLVADSGEAEPEPEPAPAELA